MSVKSHASARTTSEWVTWAKNEGFDDIEEACGETSMPGKVLFWFKFKGFYLLDFLLRCIAHCVVHGSLQRPILSSIQE